MRPFAYVEARDAREAVAALGAERGKRLPIAGGMDLLALLKDDVLAPERLVSVRGLDRGIAGVPGGGLAIGAAVTLAELAASGEVARLYPALADAAGAAATPQIRNRGTVGGNLAQRPRCWYFRHPEFDCLKKGGARCFARDGENQLHAIFGDGPCHIVHPSSLAVPLVALGATFHALGPDGEREVAAERFFEMPDRNLWSENVLAPGEILTRVTLPPPRGRSATYEVRFKQSHDWPLAFATAVLDVDAGRIRTARVVLGAVAPVPWRSRPAEAALAGSEPGAEAAARAARAAVTEAKPMSENAYKVAIARAAVERAILRAAS